MTKLVVDYYFESNDKYLIKVLDIDDEKNLSDTGNHDLLGELEFTLHEVVTARGKIWTKLLKVPDKPNHKSEISIMASEVKSNSN